MSEITLILKFLLMFIFCFILSYAGKNDLEGLEEFKVFYSLNYTFHEFKKYSDAGHVRHMIDLFVAHCPVNPIDYQPVKNHPFIVIDSSHRRTRSILGKQLARKIGGKLIYNPPRYMIRNNLPFNSTLKMRRAFFALGVYGASYKAKKVLKDCPAVANGYFLDQVNFAIDKKFLEPPPPESSIYNWPKELIVPDLNFFIHTPNLSTPTNASIITDARTQRILNIYHHWKKPKIIYINSTSIYREMIQLIIEHINKELNTKYKVPLTRTLL